MRNTIPIVGALILALLETSAASPRLGQPTGGEELRLADQSIDAAGTRLPDGVGTVARGKVLYESLCARCHGGQGEGGTADHLIAEDGLTGEWPDKAIGSYWPYATTLFDFVRRSMPLDRPGSLSNDQTYALTAYLLYLNGVLAETAELDAAGLARVQMPNRNGFINCYEASRSAERDPACPH